jgi:hypothetical protein
MLIVSVLFVLGHLQAASAADAASRRVLCLNWSDNIETDPLLWQALVAAYPNTRVTHGKGPSQRCLFPYTAFSYDKGVVLITLAGVPGKACHGCAAVLSAVFLRRDGKALRPSSRHDAFEEAGTFGSPMAVNSIRLDGEDGIVVEGGGTFQGYSSSVLRLFLIRSGRMKRIGPDDGISSGDSDCGAGDEPCRSVEGHWRVDGRRFIIRYIGTRADGTQVDGDVVYELRKNALILVSGHGLASEMDTSRP